MTNKKFAVGHKEHEYLKDAEHLQDTVEVFTDEAIKQALKGKKVYGKPLDVLDDYNWNKMALEEAADLVNYLVAEQRKKEFVIKKIRTIIEANMTDKGPREEIHYWLDLLEGK